MTDEEWDFFAPLVIERPPGEDVGRATTIRAHQHAASAKGGLRAKALVAREAVFRRSST